MIAPSSLRAHGFPVQPALAVIMGILLSSPAVLAVPNTWTGAGDAVTWEDPDNWSDGVPVEGDSVEIGAGASVILTNATPDLASFTIANATLTFEGWNSALKAAEMTISGTLKHLAQSATAVDPITGEWEPDNRILLMGTNITVTASGRLDAVGLGYGPNRGPGFPAFSVVGAYSGGGYGGKGGVGNRGVPGATYGSAFAPEDPGSGGNGTGAYLAGSGGGAIRVIASQTLTVEPDGVISANGGNGTSRGGGGSGGGIWLSGAIIQGSGTITADGGAGAGVGTYGAGGGGGRIAMDSPQNDFTGTIRARGMPGTREPGRSGTFNFVSASDRDLMITNDIALPPGTSWVFRSLTVTNGAVFEIQSTPGTSGENWTNEAASRVRFEDYVTIASNATLSADGLGYKQLQGPGAGKYQSGAGYGGRGGLGNRDSLGDVYGDPNSPERLGSGGGAYTDYAGGCGGGALILDVADKLTVNGTITANGARSPARGGGGSGGSICLTAAQITGSGIIIADGGAGGGIGTYGAGGGGGRIALKTPQTDFSGTIRARGFPGNVASGRSGTLNFVSDAARDLVITENIALPPGTNWVFRSLTVTNGAVFEIQSTPGTSGENWTNEVASRVRFESHVTIASNATLSVDGLGYLESQGPGASTIYSGAGHGGAGGQGHSGIPGGTYGFSTAPDRLGSGSGRVVASPSYAGASGGGALVLEVNGVLTLDGTISANGGTGQSRTGGGSGGSIWLRAVQVGGKGDIFAKGGIRGSDIALSAGGGGGRVQIDIGWIDAFTRRPSQVVVWENPIEWPDALDFTGGISTAGGQGGSIVGSTGGDGSLSIRYLPIPRKGTLVVIQ